MALIIHRCSTCRHPDFYHRATGCLGNCKCQQPIDDVRTTTPCEVIPTFGPLGQTIPRLITPGTKWAGGDACGCQTCQDLYAQPPAENHQTTAA